MDFENLRADVNRILTKHYTPGRGGRRIDKVVVHYNAANLSIEGCYSVWQSRKASAHYQVEEGGRIGQLVHDWDTAWHAGNFTVNQSSIGIEHANRPDGTISPACLDAGAHLVAALCKIYSLGRPEWGKNVFPHKHFAATSCPGQIYGSQKHEYIKRAQYWYGVMMGGAAPAPAPAVPAPAPSGIVEDGLWGKDTTKALQRHFGTVADGEVWHQWPDNKMKGLTYGWCYDRTQKGSPVIAALQRHLGVSADGIMGKDTANAIIKRYGNGCCDGKLDWQSPAIKGLQHAVNTGKL